MGIQDEVRWLADVFSLPMAEFTTTWGSLVWSLVRVLRSATTILRPNTLSVAMRVMGCFRIIRSLTSGAREWFVHSNLYSARLKTPRRTDFTCWRRPVKFGVSSWLTSVKLTIG